MKNFIKSNLNEIDQMLMQMDDEMLTRKLDVFDGATIGQHVRHIIELYSCLLNGVADGVVCYDKRKRDTSLESGCNTAREAIQSIIGQIEQIGNDRQIFIKSDFAPDESESILIRSSLNRELAYNLEHSIHHQALIKIGVSQFQEKIILAQNFGIAPATIRFHRQTCVQ